MKKYKLRQDITTTYAHHRVYRIEALMSFSDVEIGDLGGWVESEENLSHFQNCWIYGDAAAMGDALVRDNAQVKDKALVSMGAVIQDSALIEGSARLLGPVIANHCHVTGTAMIAGKAPCYLSMGSYIHSGKWLGTPLQIQGSMYNFNVSGPNSVSIGCKDRTFEEWDEKFVPRATKRGYTRDQIDEYQHYFKLAKRYIKQNELLLEHDKTSEFINPEAVDLPDV